MTFSTETIGRLLASFRGYAQYFVGFATSLGLVSASQSKTLTDSFSEIFNGLAQIIHGFTSVWQIGVVVLTPIISVVLARWSSNSAKTTSQAVAVKAAVEDPNTPISPAAKDAIVTAAAKV
jgi:short subunit fatty acids transporter